MKRFVRFYLGFVALLAVSVSAQREKRDYVPDLKDFKLQYDPGPAFNR